MDMQGGIPSGGPRGEFISLPFPVSESHLLSLVHGPFLQLQSQQHAIFSFFLTFASILTYFFYGSDPLAFLFKVPS